MADIVKIGAIGSYYLPNFAINLANGTKIHVHDAQVIRVIAEALRLPYQVIVPEDGKGLGYKKPGGNWTGILGLLMRSEVDIAIVPMSILKEIEEIDYSYPCCISDLTFMTDKPAPTSKSSAIFYPFSYTMWITLTMTLIAIPLLFYIFMSRKVKYLSILLNVFGYLLEQSLTFEVRRMHARMLLTAWLLGAMIISYGYKAVLLSSLTSPTTTVIRDIPDLAKAAAENSVTCFGFNGANFDLLTGSVNEDWRKIGACLEENEANFKHDDFYDFTSKKVRVNSRHGLSFDDDIFFISEDSFTIDIYGYPVSKNFYYLKKLNTLINKLNAFGIYKKIDDEEKYYWQSSQMPENLVLSGISLRISVSDLSGAFIVLLLGWFLALLALILEIFLHKNII